MPEDCTDGGELAAGWEPLSYGDERMPYGSATATGAMGNAGPASPQDGANIAPRWGEIAQGGPT